MIDLDPVFSQTVKEETAIESSRRENFKDYITDQNKAQVYVR